MSLLQRLGHPDEVDGTDLLVESGHKSHLQVQKFVKSARDLLCYRVVRLDQVLHCIL